MNALLKIIIFVICLVTFVNALVFVVISLIHSFHAYTLIWNNDYDGRPGINLVESLDGFLLAIVFIIFSIGFGKLFIPDNTLIQRIKTSWLNPKSFSELKIILWEAVLTTLMVLFAIQIVRQAGEYDYKMLILPVSILVMAGGLKLIRH